MSIFSGASTVIEIGIFCGSSSRRCAVTVMASSRAASLVCGFSVVSCAVATPTGSATAMANESKLRPAAGNGTVRVSFM